MRFKIIFKRNCHILQRDSLDESNIIEKSGYSFIEVKVPFLYFSNTLWLSVLAVFSDALEHF